jgi:hypothetical protein
MTEFGVNDHSYSRLPISRPYAMDLKSRTTWLKKSSPVAPDSPVCPQNQLSDP